MCVGLAGSYSARSGAGDSLGLPCSIFDALVCDGRRVLGVLFFLPTVSSVFLFSFIFIDIA